MNAGTIEFLLDDKGKFYFMEMNARIQVEHPVTEMVTGLDLIKMQIQVAAGEKLKIKQDNVQIKGNAIECRIYAEDPENNFMPSPGKLTELNLPGGPGVRVDTHVYPNYEISPYYDSMIAKIITHGKNRNEAIRIMRRALEEIVISPIKSTVSFSRHVLSNPLFLRGQFSTDFIEKIFEKKE